MEIHKTILICVAGCLSVVVGWPNGKISASCDNMLPIHGGSVPQSSPAPYIITVSNTTFNPGDIITVSLQSKSSSDAYKGFLIQAHLVGGDGITGIFTTSDSNAQILTCGTQPNSAVSHTNSNLKKTITAFWTAPQGAGPVHFRATVLTSYSHFWSGVESEVIQALQMSNATCGSQKFCLMNPLNCSPRDNTCLFMSSSPSTNGYVYEMSGPTSGYVAIGFSDDQKMGNDDVFICTKNSSGNILVQHGYNTGTVAPTMRNSSAGSIVSSYKNGVLKCSFITSSNSSTLQRASGSSSYYVFLVSGPSNADGKIQKHTKMVISSHKVDLSTTTSVTTSNSGTSSVVLGHGSLMLIAWMTTGSIGMIMARYMKSAAGKPFLGKAAWFQVHFFLMILTVILTIIAFIMVFVNVAGWSGGVHPVLGCIVMILSFFQPFAALFRPDPKHERRFIFNFGHGINAFVIKVLAVAAIFLGLILVDISPNQWMPKVMGGFYAWEVLFYIILETNMHLKTKDIYKNDYKIEIVALAIFICGNLAFLVALLVGIGQSA
ncbi:putative ferric-chelate reductase 1 isoform X2 [Engystomops pustulosus]|uniref:putative ferric-chelate reductase 1 isoform X2 n=1 Tax=Engystomops pustulosus TaxID=76066 RepID=UPI003AFA887E